MAVMITMTKIFHIQKSAEQATFEWMPPLPIYSLGQSIYVYQNFLNAVKAQTKLFENKLIERENLSIKSHVRLIKIKSHFSDAHFDDKFSTFGMAFAL